MAEERQDASSTKRKLVRLAQNNETAFRLADQEVEALASLLEALPDPAWQKEDLDGRRRTAHVWETWQAALVRLEALEADDVPRVAPIVPLLWKLPQLHRLLAHASDLQDLPASFARLQHVRDLNVDGADFDPFPQVVASLHSLESFSYEYCVCPVEEVLDTLVRLPRLKRLRLMPLCEENGGDVLPASVGRLQAMEELLFSRWIELQELPESIGDLTRLRVLDISNDDYSLGDTSGIRELPEALTRLSGLQSLALYGLQDLTQLPRGFSRLTSLRHLDVRNSGIAELQLEPAQWQQLERLSMHGPLPDFRQCSNLKEFFWRVRPSVPDSDNKPDLSEHIRLPHIASLKKLESLWLAGGVLDSADFLADLGNLRSLTLTCDLERLPSELTRLQHLERLDIRYAYSLEALPEELGRMPSLKSLRLWCCGVRELPHSVLSREGLKIEANGCPFCAGFHHWRQRGGRA